MGRNGGQKQRPGGVDVYADEGTANELRLKERQGKQVSAITENGKSLGAEVECRSRDNAEATKTVENTVECHRSR